MILIHHDSIVGRVLRSGLYRRGGEGIDAWRSCTWQYGDIEVGIVGQFLKVALS